jgi:hypothetical protein
VPWVAYYRGKWRTLKEVAKITRQKPYLVDLRLQALQKENLLWMDPEYAFHPDPRVFLTARTALIRGYWEEDEIALVLKTTKKEVGALLASALKKIQASGHSEVFREWVEEGDKAPTNWDYMKYSLEGELKPYRNKQFFAPNWPSEKDRYHE